MTMTTTTKTRIVTLSNRPPVRIKESEWPVIADSFWHDGLIRCQANRTAWLKVRRHDDGRTLVYGGRESRWQGERDKRSGLLIDKTGDVVAAIYQVADDLGYVEQLAAEAVGDLPAEEI